jgi:2-dehydro-3-deoxyphosphogluconate aldolase / (4S)-4-hydroxy-2-oxoglutarate aldolase
VSTGSEQVPLPLPSLHDRSALLAALRPVCRAMESALTTEAARPGIPIGISAGGVVAIGRRVAAEAVPAVVGALAAGGIRAFELTLNEPEADVLRAIEAAAEVGPGLGLEIGAGTILSIDAARRALDAGATFLVMPHVDAELVRWAAEHGVPVLPGCATPTEVLAAWRAGAAAVKVFPASSLGVSFIRECRGPFPGIPLLPTGGVTVENAPAFVAAGAIGVGMGGWLLGDAEPAGVRNRAAQIVAAVAAAREQLP